ncbi:hypothetical protein PIB30_003147 [Stylosanthes scabra]|uniref:Uncharacterized protein n=1 Tax=Stylosanthes scabra TaxID=79078 RepID=A0ABU6Z0Z8_9FABA|nr:hypothetical protein [Stylosanthes scabra]
MQEETRKVMGSAKLETATLTGVVFLGYPIVGFRNRMKSSGTCLDSKKPDHSMRIKDFIKDVQSLVELEATALCGLKINNGIPASSCDTSRLPAGKTEE